MKCNVENMKLKIKSSGTQTYNNTLPKSCVDKTVHG